jgi:ketosteroid isomerase-like protein
MSLRFNTAEEAETAFYRAFQELDATLMSQVWSDLPEACCLHPGGGLLLGKAAIMQSWTEIFAAAKRPSMVHRCLQTTTLGELSVHLVEELIRPGGDPQGKASRVIATNVYRRDLKGWRMLTHHSSLPLVAATAKERSGRLH